MNVLKNIILICDCAHVLGGIENVAFQSAIQLKRMGYNVIVFASMGSIAKELIDNKIKVVCLDQNDILSEPNRLKAILQGLCNFKAYNTLCNVLKTYNSNDTIVHFHCWSKALSPIVFKVTAKYKFKIAITTHDYFSICPNGGLYNYRQNHICTLNPLGMKCLMSNCDSRNYFQKCYRFLRSIIQKYWLSCNKYIYLITISNTTERHIYPYLKKYISKTFRLLNPVILDEGGMIKITSNNFYLFVARLSNEKGCELFCKAITDLGLKGKVLGDGYLFKKLKNKYPDIVFEGWVSGEKKYQILKTGKALIFPSLWYEGAPLTILEMLSNGIPCIVPDNCAASEFIKDGYNGLVFKTGNLDSLKDKICIYEHCDLNKMQRNISDSFDREKFKPEIHAKNLVNIYKQILND